MQVLQVQNMLIFSYFKGLHIHTQNWKGTFIIQINLETIFFFLLFRTLRYFSQSNAKACCIPYTKFEWITIRLVSKIGLMILTTTYNSSHTLHLILRYCFIIYNWLFTYHSLPIPNWNVLFPVVSHCSSDHCITGWIDNTRNIGKSLPTCFKN